MIMAMTMMMKKPGLVILVFCAILAAPSSAVDPQSDGVGQWSLVTKLNFSSQIRLHPHILFLVTVPWCGESRTLMRDISSMVTNGREEFDSLKLMFMHRNTEKMLADAIGATDNEITVLHYHHSVAYKYRGRLRAQNILFSIRSQISVPPADLPLKSLSNPAELKTFLDSTDRALLVLEFCGWTSKLLDKGRNNVSENGLAKQAEFIGWTSTRLTPTWMNMKEMENGKMTCDIGNEMDKVPWLVDFTLVNSTASVGDKGANKMPGVLLFCTQEEYQRFESFFAKFTAVAKDFFLPFERHRYGLVSERSMLSALGIREGGSWLAVLHFAGCPSCLKIIKKEDDLNDVLQMDNSVVSELEGDGRALEPVLPANRPSVLLFVDRSSDSVEIRSKSKKVLDDFRALALHIHDSCHVDEQSGENHEKLFQGQALGSTSGPPKLTLSSAAHMIKLKEKMSTLMVVNEGKPVTLEKISANLQGNSLQEIVDYVLQQREASKLSSLAKELGFQLLSDDIDIKLANRLPSEAEAQSHQESLPETKDDLVSKGIDWDQDQSPKRESFLSEVKDQYGEGKNEADVFGSIQLSAESERFVPDHKRDIDGDEKVEETISSLGHKSAYQPIEFPGFEGSFYFSDGNYQSLRSLTGESKIPRLVIVDPALEHHYVFPEEADLDYYSMSDYLSRFLNGSLVPYRQSESLVQSPKELVQPPFANTDFHEVDSIPRLTSNGFSDLVVGVNESGSDAWHKDVLVLFSNRWCGFCQRMELVVREVYRAMRGYVRASKIGSSNGESVLHGDTSKDIKLKLPSMYLLDCTLNDCSLILRSINQTETYPALMLFPAEKKTALPYEGHVGVTDVIKFIADHGLNSRHLIHETGILLSTGRNSGRNENSRGSTSSTESPEDSTTAKERSHEVLLANQVPKKAVKHHILNSGSPTSSDRAQVVAGSFLIATDKLQNEEPFGKSKILIVWADQGSGFLGLIVNKHIRWDALNELAEGLQILAEAPLSFGGPVMQRGAPLVALTREPTEDKYPQVLPNIYYLDQSSMIDKIREFKSGNRSVTDCWFFVGYSSWGWDQLYDEIADGAWEVSDDSFTNFAWP